MFIGSLTIDVNFTVANLVLRFPQRKMNCDSSIFHRNQLAIWNKTGMTQYLINSILKPNIIVDTKVGSFLHYETQGLACQIECFIIEFGLHFSHTLNLFNEKVKKFRYISKWNDFQVNTSYFAMHHHNSSSIRYHLTSFPSQAKFVYMYP